MEHALEGSSAKLTHGRLQEVTVKLQSLTVQQILELTDPEIDELSASEQRLVAEVIGSVLDFELRGTSPRTEDPRKALEQVVSSLMPARTESRKLH